MREYKKGTSERNLVMSSSTFIGSGYYGGHIGGSMNATWDMLRQTIVQTLEFNMYGIPLTGFPVCGFKGKRRYVTYFDVFGINQILDFRNNIISFLIIKGK